VLQCVVVATVLQCVAVASVLQGIAVASVLQYVCETCESVMSNMRMSRVTHTNESAHMNE